MIEAREGDLLEQVTLTIKVVVRCTAATKEQAERVAQAGLNGFLAGYAGGGPERGEELGRQAAQAAQNEDDANCLLGCCFQEDGLYARVTPAEALEDLATWEERTRRSHYDTWEEPL